MPRRHSPSQALQPSPGFVLVGRVVAPHGVGGEVRIEVLSDYPQRFSPGATVHVRGTPYRVAAASRRGSTAVVQLEGIHSRDQAAGLRGAAVEVPEGDVPPPPPGAYYYFQVIGLEVRTVQGERLGVVTDILTTCANDVYVVRADGQEVLIPALDDVVVGVDVAGGRMTVDLPPGLR